MEWMLKSIEALANVASISGWSLLAFAESSA
jgi:hypothetical protein